MPEIHTDKVKQQPTWEDVVISLLAELPEGFSKRLLVRDALRRFPLLCFRTPDFGDVLFAALENVYERGEDIAEQIEKRMPRGEAQPERR